MTLGETRRLIGQRQEFMFQIIKTQTINTEKEQHKSHQSVF